MNRKLILAVAFLTLSAPLALHAQETTTPPPAAAGAARTPDQVANMYANKLSLTDDQKTKIKPIIADRQQAMLAMRSDTSLKPREKMQKIKSITADTDTRLKAVLTPDQFTKYQAMEAEQREKMQERRQGKTAH